MGMVIGLWVLFAALGAVAAARIARGRSWGPVGQLVRVAIGLVVGGLAFLAFYGLLWNLCPMLGCRGGIFVGT